MTDWEFVFDGVVGYLKSPIWNIPIVTFMEKNCIVFEPNGENELSHTEIHKEYSALVEDLLSSYLKDVGITEEQFVCACEAGSNDSSAAADQSLFEQVWAAEDFVLFRKLMVKKNVDMELQALHMIQQRSGMVPDIFTSGSACKPSKKSTRSQQRVDEVSLLKDVMEQSKLEYEKEKEKRREVERMEKSLALSKEESERLHDLAERELMELERVVGLSLKLEKRNATDKEKTSEPKQSPESKSRSTSHKSKKSTDQTKNKPASKPTKESPKTASVEPKKSAVKQKTETPQKTDVSQKAENKEKTKPAESSAIVKNGTQKSPPSTASPPAKSSATKQPATSSATETKNHLAKGDMTPGEAASNWLLSARAEADTSSSKNFTGAKSEGAPMEDEIRQRANYLRMQREKLMNLKKQERDKRLQTFEEDQPVKRPMSSRVARRVTRGTEAEEVPKSVMGEQDEKKLAMRRALAERLKKEVIHQQFR